MVSTSEDCGNTTSKTDIKKHFIRQRFFKLPEPETFPQPCRFFCVKFFINFGLRKTDE